MFSTEKSTSPSPTPTWKQYLEWKVQSIKNNNNNGQKSSSTRLAFNSSLFLLWVHPLHLLLKESISFSAFVLNAHPLRQPKRSSMGNKHIQNKPPKAKWPWRVEDRKTFMPPPYTVPLGRSGGWSFRCHVEEDGTETWADSWQSYDQEQLGLSSFLVPQGKQRVFSQMVREQFLQSLQLSRKRARCHCQKKKTSMKRQSSV